MLAEASTPGQRTSLPSGTRTPRERVLGFVGLAQRESRFHRETLDGSPSIKIAQGIEIAQRYRIVGILGRGGMGTVYRALDRELSRDVAIKVLRSEIAQQKTALERFKREIQLSSQITHRNVLRVFDLGAHETLRFLTMQHVPKAPNLDESLARLVAGREGGRRGDGRFGRERRTMLTLSPGV